MAIRADVLLLTWPRSFLLSTILLPKTSKSIQFDVLFVFSLLLLYGRLLVDSRCRNTSPGEKRSRELRAARGPKGRRDETRRDVVFLAQPFVKRAPQIPAPEPRYTWVDSATWAFPFTQEQAVEKDGKRTRRCMKRASEKLYRSCRQPCRRLRKVAHHWVSVLFFFVAPSALSCKSCQRFAF